MDTDMIKRVKKARKGDTSAFVQCIKAYQDSMYNMAMYMLADRDRVQDVIQEATMKAFEKISTLREPRYFKSWLIRIVMNECQALRRKEYQRPPAVLFDDRRNAQNASPAFITNVEIREAVDSLPVDFRMVVILFYFEDLSVKEIARAIDQAEATVRTRLHRARKQLHHYFTDEDNHGVSVISEFTRKVNRRESL